MYFCLPKIQHPAARVQRYALFHKSTTLMPEKIVTNKLFLEIVRMDRNLIVNFLVKFIMNYIFYVLNQKY